MAAEPTHEEGVEEAAPGAEMRSSGARSCGLHSVESRQVKANLRCLTFHKTSPVLQHRSEQENKKQVSKFKGKKKSQVMEKEFRTR